MSSASTGRSSSYLGLSEHKCDCGEFCGMWVSRTPRNPGRVFIKCICVRVSFPAIFVVFLLSNVDVVFMYALFVWVCSATVGSGGGRLLRTILLLLVCPKFVMRHLHLCTPGPPLEACLHNPQVLSMEQKRNRRSGPSLMHCAGNT